jgi:hypothetical protein
MKPVPHIPPPPPAPERPPLSLDAPVTQWTQYLRGPLHGNLGETEIIIGAVLLVFVFWFFLAFFLIRAGENKARRKLVDWAAKHGYEILKRSVVSRPRGPFDKKPAWQTVCAVTVRTPQGWNRSAWVCFGNFFAWGFWRKPEVQWDEAAGPRA